MKHPVSVIVSLSIGGVLGALVWMLSPAIIGKPEPWDGDGVYYPLALFLAGFVGYWLYPKRMLLLAVGIYLGQWLVLLTIGTGPLLILGMVFLVFYSLIALAGAGSARFLRKMLGAIGTG